MIAVGSCWTARWDAPHLLDVVVTELRQDYLIAETVHRCPIQCYLQAMRSTLPIHGLQRYDYRDFAKLFLPLAVGAVPLPGTVTAHKNYTPKEPTYRPAPGMTLDEMRLKLAVAREART